MSVLFTVSQQYFVDSSAVVAGVESFTQLPRFWVCPDFDNSKETTEGDQKNVPATEILRSLALLGKTDMRSSLKTIETTTRNAIFQDELIHEAEQNVNNSGVRAEWFNMFLDAPHRVSVSANLVVFGFCYLVDSDILKLTALDTWIGYLNISLPTFGTKQHYFSIAAQTQKFFPPRGLGITSGSYLMEIRRISWRRRKSKRQRCKHTDKEKDSGCIFECIQPQLRKDFQCELYNPMMRQRLDSLCKFTNETDHGLLKKVEAVIVSCNPRCFKLCVENKYQITASSVRKDIPSGEPNTQIKVQLKGTSTSIFVEEREAVSTSAYLGYIGGCVGFCFGVTIYSCFAAFLSVLLQSVETGNSIHISRTECIKLASWLKTLLLLCCLANYFGIDMMKEQVSGRIARTDTLDDKDNTSFLICGPWMNISALTDILKAHWDGKVCNKADNDMSGNKYLSSIENQYSIDSLESIVDGVSLLCNSFFNLSPFKYELEKSDYDELSDNWSCYSNLLSRILKKSNLKFTNLLHSIASNGTGVIKKATEPLGHKLDIQIEVLLTPVRMCFTFPIPARNFTKFAGFQDSIRLHLIKHYLYYDDSWYYGDEHTTDSLLLMVSTQFNPFPQAEHILIYPKEDYKLSISTTRLNQIHTRIKPCSKGPDNVTACNVACLAKRSNCSLCKPTLLGLDGPSIRNLTGYCHMFSEPDENCERRLLATDLSDKKLCNDQCPGPCKATLHKMQVTSYPSKHIHSDTQVVSIELSREDNYVITEFYLYDWLLITCTFMGLLGLFFGYSFISVVKVILSLIMVCHQYSKAKGRHDERRQRTRTVSAANVSKKLKREVGRRSLYRTYSYF